MSILLDQTGAKRAILSEQDCHVDWVDALRAVPGNPWGAAVHRFGDVTLVGC